ncbi:hypothetical protein V6N12_009368 [Hibiscus sabdariffa]|uniref:Uncharacterized protein n=1 Tax=Hibiscus sabdariffa TaxID=183260 RepID=A0ABR2E8W5_9ROSI
MISSSRIVCVAMRVIGSLGWSWKVPYSIHSFFLESWATIGRMTGDPSSGAWTTRSGGSASHTRVKHIADTPLASSATWHHPKLRTASRDSSTAVRSDLATSNRIHSDLIEIRRIFSPFQNRFIGADTWLDLRLSKIPGSPMEGRRQTIITGRPRKPKNEEKDNGNQIHIRSRLRKL